MVLKTGHGSAWTFAPGTGTATVWWLCHIQDMNMVRNCLICLTMEFPFWKLISAGCNSSLKNNECFHFVPHQRCKHWPFILSSDESEIE